MKPAVNKFIPIFALFTLTLLTLTPMQAFKVVCDNCMEASAGCTDCKRIKAQGPDLSWKISVENRTPAQSEDRIVGQMQTPEELAGYKRKSVSRRDDNLEKVYSCEDSLPIGSPLRATGIIVMAENEEQFKKEKWKFARGSIQMVGECHALTDAHNLVPQTEIPDLSDLSTGYSAHQEKLNKKRKFINEGLEKKIKTSTSFRVCIKRINASMSFDLDQCDKVEKVVTLDFGPDSDLALVRLSNCRGADPLIGHFDLPAPTEIYNYLMKDPNLRSKLPIALTGFAGDRSSCALSVDTCSPGLKPLNDRLSNMMCNNVPGQSGGAISFVVDRSGNIVSKEDILGQPDSPNFRYKILGLTFGLRKRTVTREDQKHSDKFLVSQRYSEQTTSEMDNVYMEFRRTDIYTLNEAIAKDYEENKAQIDANIAQMKKQGEVQLAEELKQQKARSRNNYSSANKPSEGI